jgi:hypothetical protein
MSDLHPDFLTMWVIYNNPTDYPGKFVVRRQWASRGLVHVAHDPETVTSSLIEARKAIPVGLFNIGRMPGDDRAIQEVWL